MRASTKINTAISSNIASQDKKALDLYTTLALLLSLLPALSPFIVSAYRQSEDAALRGYSETPTPPELIGFILLSSMVGLVTGLVGYRRRPALSTEIIAAVPALVILFFLLFGPWFLLWRVR